MSRVRRSLPLLLLCACATSGAATEGSTAPTAGSAAAAAAGPSSALDAEIIETAATATTVHKMKLRVDGDGNVVKLAVYHDAADSVPQAVRDLAAERFAGSPVTHYETELYADHGRVYEVEVDKGGVACELAASPDGTELYTECHVDPASLSDAVKATVESVAPGGKILEAETKKGPSLDELTVEVEVGGQELYLRLASDGSLIQALRRIPAVIEVPLP
ncbi:MAG: hypothetical protein K0V04_22270 [Deltaproteobacteria bacterium]|nr:hypothetical protein [Deltaproteobacteria bacterium]